MLIIATITSCLIPSSACPFACSYLRSQYQLCPLRLLLVLNVKMLVNTRFIRVCILFTMTLIQYETHTIWIKRKYHHEYVIPVCLCLCVVDFLAIFQKLNPQKKAAVEEQCRDWAVFCSIFDSDDWKLVKRNLITSVGGTLATDLDNLWKQLHPSQSTGLSHSIHSRSCIYRSARIIPIFYGTRVTIIIIGCHGHLTLLMSVFVFLYVSVFVCMWS